MSDSNKTSMPIYVSVGVNVILGGMEAAGKYSLPVAAEYSHCGKALGKTFAGIADEIACCRFFGHEVIGSGN